MRTRAVIRMSVALGVAVAAAVASAAPAASVSARPQVQRDTTGDWLNEGAQTFENSAWYPGYAGYDYTVTSTSVTLQMPPSQSTGKRANATFTWTLPTSVPPGGAKGNLHVHGQQFDGNGDFAPGFEIDGALIDCTGITTGSGGYGNGCAQGDHAAVVVHLQPNTSGDADQEFLIKGVPDTVKIVTRAPQNVDFAYTLGAPAVENAPTSTAFNKPVSVPDPSDGGAATFTSPLIAAVGAAPAPQAVEADVTGLSAQDHAFFESVRHECYTNFVETIYGAHVGQKLVNSKLWTEIDVFLLTEKMTQALAQCVALVDAVEQMAAGQAPNEMSRVEAGRNDASSAGACAVTGAQLGVSGTRLTSLKADKKPAIRVTCVRSGSTLRIKIASAVKGTPLSKLLGKHFRLTIVRGLKAPIGGRIGVTFRKH